MTKPFVSVSRLMFIHMLLAVSLVTSSIAAGGNPPGPAGISKSDLDAIAKKLTSSESLRVDLVQRKTSPARPDRPVVVKGHALFQKPDRFRWVLGEPINEETIFNGKELFKYLPRENVAARYSAKGQQAKEVKRVVDFVLNVESIFKAYNLVSGTREVKGAAKTVKLEFKPANPESDEIDTLELIIDEDRGFVSRVFFTLRNKSSLAVDFSNPDRRGLTPLSFSLPASVKVNDIM